MGKWSNFPYVAGGSELARGPRWRLISVCCAFAAFWILLGLLSDRIWQIGLGLAWLIALVVALARRRLV
jgi:hypothetical protein